MNLKNSCPIIFHGYAYNNPFSVIGFIKLQKIVCCRSNYRKMERIVLSSCYLLLNSNCENILSISNDFRYIQASFLMKEQLKILVENVFIKCLSVGRCGRSTYMSDANYIPLYSLNCYNSNTKDCFCFSLFINTALFYVFIFMI